MAIIKINKIADSDDLKQLTQEFPEYIKLSVDINQEIVYGGSRLHYDCEQKLIKNENSQEINIWSGGVNLATKKIDYSAVANIKPSYSNPSTEIISTEIRQKFKLIVNRYFPDYE
jgi:ABC-type uncharacterized transport system ATPase subunit